MSTIGRPKKSTPRARAAALAAAGVTADNVINALLIELGIEMDSDLAALAGVSKTTVSNWRKRNSVPFELVVYLSLTGALDLDYVLTRRRRLSGFLKPSESLSDARLQRAITAAALAEVVPVEMTARDIERAADQLEELRKTYVEFLLTDYELTKREAGFLAGKYVDFAIKLLDNCKQTALARRMRHRQP